MLSLPTVQQKKTKAKKENPHAIPMETELIGFLRKVWGIFYESKMGCTNVSTSASIR